MEMIEDQLDLTNKCRACLANDDNMASLFDVYEDNLTLAEILRSCLNTEEEVFEGDGFPCRICDSCILVLIKFYNFSILYEENKTKLQSLLVNANENMSTTEEGSPVILDSDTVHEVSNVKSENEVCLLFDNSNQELFEQVLANASSENSSTQKEFSKFKLDTSEGADDIKQVFLTTVEMLQNQSNEDSKIIIKAEFEDSNGAESANAYEYETVTKYVCNICGETHLFRQGFQTHMRVRHKIDDLNFANYTQFVKIKKNVVEQVDVSVEPLCCCKHCHKTFQDAVTLRAHLAIHRNGKQYICDVCGAGFTRKTYLIDHMEGHSTEKKHVCKFCGKAYQRRTVLKAHLRVHTHPYHYVCEKCGRAFTNNSSLKTHTVLLHTKERNFHCVICGQDFPLKSTLLKHLRRHEKRETGEKEFSCTSCEMRYKDKSSLKRHFEVKHMGKVELVSCPDCPKKYTSKANLVKHQKQHHSVTSPS